MQEKKARVTFTQNVGFRKTLNQRVDAYFKAAGRSQRDNPAMYFKTFTIISWVVGAWWFTLFGPAVLWMKVLGCVALGCGLAGVGFSVGHDANHGGYSSRPWLNHMIGLSYDVIGLSSYLWRFRHNYLHHTFTNILGHDVEIHGDGLVRMTPYMEHQWYHRYQHFLIPFIYAVIPFYWAIADLQMVFSKRRYHDHALPNLKASELLTLLIGKVIWASLFIAAPIAVGYSPLQAIAGFGITYITYGILICHVFMLAHVLEPAEFIQPSPDSNTVDDEWAIAQVKTTVDFAPKNAFLNWYLGGLNYQTVHHLFPQICHIHYPQIAPILADVCQEFGVQYNVYPSFTEALTYNYSWLKRLGENDPALAV